MAADKMYWMCKIVLNGRTRYNWGCKSTDWIASRTMSVIKPKWMSSCIYTPNVSFQIVFSTKSRHINLTKNQWQTCQLDVFLTFSSKFLKRSERVMVSTQEKILPIPESLGRSRLTLNWSHLCVMLTTTWESTPPNSLSISNTWVQVYSWLCWFWWRPC